MQPLGLERYPTKIIIAALYPFSENAAYLSIG